MIVAPSINAAHPSKTVKDGAPSAGMVQTRVNVKGGPLACDNAKDPGYPGSLRTWCSSLSTSVLAALKTMSIYLGRLSLRSLPDTDLLHIRENGPGGIRTRI